MFLQIKPLACLCLRSELNQIIRQGPLIYPFRQIPTTAFSRRTGKYLAILHNQITILTRYVSVSSFLYRWIVAVLLFAT